VSELHLREGGPSLVCDLDREIVERLVALKVVTASPLGPGRWELRAAGKVGVVRVGPLTVWVKPKVTIARLLWLLGWAERPVFDSPGPVAVRPADELVPALAEAFCGRAEYAVQAGLLQGYREVEGTESVLRGRLRAGDQLRRRYGLVVPVLVRYDDYLVDTAENQILKAAAVRLLGLPGVGPAVRARLANLRKVLADVSDIVAGRPLPAWHANRLNARYHDALWLAGIVLSAGSIDHDPGSMRVDGFLVDLYQVFENFVCVSLSTALERIGGRCRSQDRHTLDEEQGIDIRPDLVWRLDGRPVAVIDAKYKAERPAGFPQSDLYQALAYATAYQLGEAHLVYAQGNEVAHRWTVRHAGVSIAAHTLDLDQDASGVLAQVDTLALRVADSDVRALAAVAIDGAKPTPVG
jgi:5-methylcytosine-specific restriction enzyme subunit McrC